MKKGGSKASVHLKHILDQSRGLVLATPWGRMLMGGAGLGGANWPDAVCFQSDWKVSSFIYVYMKHLRILGSGSTGYCGAKFRSGFSAALSTHHAQTGPAGRGCGS